MRIRHAGRLKGRICLPGDKSISHRAAMLAAIAGGKTTITNFATSADCRSTLDCLRSLGVLIERSGSTVTVEGVGKRGLKRASNALDCGNSGTTMRLLAGILAGQPFTTVITGDESLRSRPMKRIIAPLAEMGCRIESIEGKAPLEIYGNPSLVAVDYDPPVSSAQVKSCVLLAGLYASGLTTVHERTPTRDHTERMLEWFGADITIKNAVDGVAISVSGDSELTAHDIEVPGDVSSSAFFAVAAASLPGSEITMENVGLNPSRIAAIDFLTECGASIDILNARDASGEPVGDIRVGSTLDDLGDDKSPRILDGSRIANLIDEIPILSVFGTQLPGGLEIRDARELRVKESDRIRSVVTNLRRMGAKVEEYDDGMKIGPSKLYGAELESFGDHRIAMAFAIAGSLAEGETTIRGAECTDVSFPDFFVELEKLVER
jgi:3-phosphoshikimate 1-carboxyvinyltransferase